MALRYGFFDSEITGYDDEGMPEFDRAESSDFLAMFIAGIISNGVLAVPGDCFQVLAGDGMTLQVQPGFGVIEGRFACAAEAFPATLPAADTANRRIDRVILRVNYPDRLCEVIARAGTPSPDPQPPELLRTSGDYYELCLAEVAVRANQTVIAQADITDTRPDTRVCGWVTGLVQQVDTSTLFLQWQDAYQRFYNDSTAEFATWLEDIRRQLGSDVVSTLMGMINDKTDKTTTNRMADSILQLQSGKADKTTTDTLAKNILDLEIKKGDKPSVAQVEVPASGWLGGSAPYLCTVKLPGVTAASIVELGISSTATKDQAMEWIGGQIADGGQDAGSITLKAYGHKPTLDLPATAVVWN